MLSRLTACILILLSVAAAPHTYVLETGSYDQITIGDGEIWLGVYPAADHTEIRQCTLRVSRVPNPVDGTYPNQVTKIACTDSNPLFMLKGSAKVKPGNVTALYRQGDDYPDKIAVALNGKSYLLQTSDTQSVERLTLKAGSQQMVLGECGSRDSIYPVWAGDLDGDGRLDVYVRIEHHNFGVEQILFLSSADATGKAMTAQAAKFTGRKLD
jgi:hypothetical protein